MAGCVVRREGNRAAERSHCVAAPAEMQENKPQILMSPRIIRIDPDQPLQQIDSADVVARRFVQPGKLPKRDAVVRSKLKNLLIDPRCVDAPPDTSRLLRHADQSLDIVAWRF
jgi:hypothetical protein